MRIVMMNTPSHECTCKFCRPSRAARQLRLKYADDPETQEVLSIIEVGLDAWYEDTFSDAMDIDRIAAEMGLDYLTVPNLIDRIVADIRHLRRLAYGNEDGD